MPFYRYKARDSQGKYVTGLAEAPNTSTAARLLRDKQLFVINLSVTQERTASSSLGRLKKIGFQEIVNLTRQLATMIVAGLSIPDALTILRTQTTNQTLVKLLADIEHQIIGGGNLGDALSKYPQQFSPIYIALIRAGESSGTLDKVLERLAQTLETQNEFKSKVKGAMIYPVIIMVGMVGVVSVMMVVVIPKLSEMYKEFNLKLPPTTQFLISMSDFMVHFWWLLILLFVGGGFLYRAWKKTATGELILDTLILKLPLFGELQKKVIMTEFTRTFAMLIAAGIHVLDALAILKDALGNTLYRNAIGEISKKIEKGFPMGASFGQYAIFPPILSQMMKVGEETGKLDDTLNKLSRYFETESEHLVKGLTTAMEPLIMVVLGVGVGFIVISIITPIYNLTGQFK